MSQLLHHEILPAKPSTRTVQLTCKVFCSSAYPSDYNIGIWQWQIVCVRVKYIIYGRQLLLFQSYDIIMHIELYFPKTPEDQYYILGPIYIITNYRKKNSTLLPSKNILFDKIMMICTYLVQYLPWHLHFHSKSRLSDPLPMPTEPGHCLNFQCFVVLVL